MQPHEASIIPYQASPVPVASRVAVFAPHPDDEVFGCGGAIALHVRAGCAVQVILLTSGGHGASTAAYVSEREAESREAARILGIAPPQYWGLPDRGLSYGEALVQRISDAIQDAAADVVYAPSPWELHPDHQATALAVMEAVRRLGAGIHLCFYEVSAPLRPNLLVDITPVAELKQLAMQAFQSQERKLPYASFVSALNRFRALTVHPAAETVEAFECYSGADLAAGAQVRIASEHFRVRAKGGATVPEDIPLVSVIVRTMGRSTLQTALRSVAAQTYGNVEIILVEASGALALSDLKLGDLDVPVKFVTQGRRLGRSKAANAGLHAAHGKYLMFLDDDDWLYPDHIFKLVQLICQSSSVRAVHTGIECVDDLGHPQAEIFNFPYAPGELRFGNFLPIHAVLFDRGLVAQGCAFDESFDLYEDWDFWLQIEQLTPFGFAPGISAAYRIHPGAGQGLHASPQAAKAATRRIFEKWGVHLSAEIFDGLITRALERREMGRKLAASETRLLALSDQLQREHQQAQESLAAAHKAAQDADHFREAHSTACRMRDELVKQGDALIQHGQTLATHNDALRKQYDLARDALIDLEGIRDRLQHEVLQSRQHAAQLAHELHLSRAHSENLDSSLQAARGDLESVLASTSWRMTKPVRWFGRMMRRLKNGAQAYRVARSRHASGLAVVRRAWRVYRTGGWGAVKQKARSLLQRTEPALHDRQSADEPAPLDYSEWVRRYDTLDESRIAALQSRADVLPVRPLVSILMPVYNPQLEDLRRAIASVQAQIYPAWELCICDDASTDKSIRPYLEKVAGEDSRIRLVLADRNGHISIATNSALEVACGEWVAFLDQDDELRPHSLLCVMERLVQDQNVRVVYSDEDKILPNGLRFDPYFKPDFNLGLLRSHNYMCHFSIYQRAFLMDLGGLRAGFEGAQDYDLALRAADRLPRDAILHIPHILYHWRVSPGSTAAGHGNKSYAFEAGRRALAEHLARNGLNGAIEEAPEAPGMYRIHWTRPRQTPMVSIIIPTRNGEALVRQCLDSLKQTAYPAYEVILVDNGSDDSAALALFAEREAEGEIRIVRDDRPFNFSMLNNNAVHCAARGEFVLLMNNDIEIVHPSWLDEMVGAAMEPGVGCVGARLWYPDGRLQHGGVILVCGVAGHAHKYLPRGEHGYMGRAVLAQDFVAVTAACLLVRRSIYEEVGGLDESLAVAFNDVDFCLRVHGAGYRNHWTPYAELIHHESVSRGYENTPEKQMRFQREIDTLQSRWAALLKKDPSYNPNLTYDAEDFALAWPPRHASEQGSRGPRIP